MSGHDLAREPVLGEQRDYRLGETPLPVRPVQPLIGAKRSPEGPGPSHSADSPTAAPPMKKVRMNEIQIQTAESNETLEKKNKDWEQLCTKLNELQEKAKDCDEWKRKYEELQIFFKEEEIKHLKELYNARVSKLSPGVLAMMNTETTAKSKNHELYRPSEVAAPQRVSSPSNARNTIPDPSDTYLAPQFQEKFEQGAKAAIQEINRARDRSLGRNVPIQRAGQSPIRKEKSTKPTEPAGPVPSGPRVTSRVVDIRKDLNTRRTFVQVAAEHPCMTASAAETCDHLINVCIARHGCPITFQSDNGKSFVGDLTKELMKRSQVAQAHSTTYHPQTIDLVERENRTLVSMLAFIAHDT